LCEVTTHPQPIHDGHIGRNSDTEKNFLKIELFLRKHLEFAGIVARETGCN
jgi:hypothetical protein